MAPGLDSSAIASVKNRRSLVAFLSLAGVLLTVSAYSWLSYMAQGLAYGDAFGAPGNEKYLAVIGSRATRFLVIALCSEEVAVAMIVWRLSADVKPIWRRLCFSLVLAAIADGCTFAVMGP